MVSKVSKAEVKRRLQAAFARTCIGHNTENHMNTTTQPMPARKAVKMTVKLHVEIDPSDVLYDVLNGLVCPDEVWSRGKTRKPACMHCQVCRARSRVWDAINILQGTESAE